MDCFSRTSGFPSREPAVNGGFVDPTDLGNLGMGDTPPRVELLRGHPELATTIELQQLDFSLSYVFPHDCAVGDKSQSDVKQRFGKAIRRRRRELDLSQEELAERAELHRTYVSDIERGDRNPSLENIEKLAKALNIKVSALFISYGVEETSVHKADSG